jgi:hypothetical protein
MHIHMLVKLLAIIDHQIMIARLIRELKDMIVGQAQEIDLHGLIDKLEKACAQVHEKDSACGGEEKPCQPG